MAAEIIGNALLSAFIQVVFDRLVSPQVLDFFGGRKLDETLLSKLKFMLLSIDAVADDAERKQFTDPRVREWLFEVKDAVLDAEDILDEIHCELSNCEVEAESESQTRTCTVPDSFNYTYSSFNREIYSRMKQVLDKLEYLANQKDVIGLKEATYSGVGSGSKLKEATYSGVGLGSKVSQKLPPTSLMVDNLIYGREAEMIFNWLTSETDHHISVMPIVGMGWIGKTMLAQLVYHDSSIYEANFDVKVWVQVSDDFDVFKITKSVLETIDALIDDSEDLEMVCGRLKEKLSGKRFFLVLDDVWNESQDKWEALLIPLNHGAKGSKILVTTRSVRVAYIMGSNRSLHLELLSELQCWHLFVIHAFQDDNHQLNDGLKGICKNIVKKCSGFPLALKTLGCLLGTMSSLSEFECVLQSELWDTHEAGIFPALLLSYHGLPSYLKQCFSYCALFPKHHEFVKQDLIQMWMAGNFLQRRQQCSSAEEIGEQYFNDLLSRSFFQQSNMNKTCFLMHDLIHDLAKCVCWDKIKLEWNQNWNQNQIPDDHLKLQKVFENLQPYGYLRKFSIMNYGGTQFPHCLFDNSLSKVVFLRLQNCKYCLCLPPLGLLPSLRHLTITGLDGIVGIYAYFYGSNSSPFKSLETLEFSDMKEWKEWEYEDMMCVFPRLQHLSLKQCPKLKGYLPKQIPHLRKLVIRDCKQLVASAPTTLEICDLELQDCGKLQFDYHPSTLKWLTIRGHNMEASVLKTIEHVMCHTSLEFLLIDSCPNMKIPMSLCYKMLEKLQISGACDSLTIFPLDLFPRLSQLELRSPNLRMISQSHTHNHLKDLRISGCHQFQSLPEQMHALLPSLENLHIKDCPKVESFPEAGLPSKLTRMDLSNCYNLITSLKEAVGANTCLRTLSIGELHMKSFPDEGLLPISLKVLQIHSCVWLEKLDYKGLCQLSSLEELILEDCTRLKCLPEEGLPISISTLRISSYCSVLKQRCLEPGCEYLGKIAHIKNIWVDGEPI